MDGIARGNRPAHLTALLVERVVQGGAAWKDTQPETDVGPREIGLSSGSVDAEQVSSPAATLNGSRMESD